jgi:mono/diheme cytochrome c family protein
VLKPLRKTIKMPSVVCVCRRLCVFGVALAFSAGAPAQGGERPGPMQSGQHASQAAAAAAPASAAASGTGTGTGTGTTTGTYSPTAFDPKQLFTNVCGWCHSAGGRVAGKGPQLMGTTLSDGEISHRIRVGKTGQMPAFATALNDAQIAAVVAYIRNLQPEGSP